MSAATSRLLRLALAGSAAAAALCFLAHVRSGSAAMLAAALLAAIAASSQALMLYGARRDGGSDAGFWSYVIAILLLALGAGIALEAGVEALVRPAGIADPVACYGALAVSVAAAALVGRQASRERGAPADAVPLGTLRAAGGPEQTTLLVEAAATVTGGLAAAAGILAAGLGGWRPGDGLGATAVGLVMAAAAGALAIQIRHRLAARPTEAPVVATPAAPAARPEVMELAAAPAAPEAESKPPPAPVRTASPPHPHGTRKKGGKRRR
jgi:hypothetical protein